MRRKSFVYSGLRGVSKKGPEIRGGFSFTWALHGLYKNGGINVYSAPKSLHEVVNTAQIGTMGAFLWLVPALLGLCGILDRLN